MSVLHLNKTKVKSQNDRSKCVLFILFILMDTLKLLKSLKNSLRIDTERIGLHQRLESREVFSLSHLAFITTSTYVYSLPFICCLKLHCHGTTVEHVFWPVQQMLSPQWNHWFLLFTSLPTSFFLSLFIYLRETETVQVGEGQRESKRGRIPSRVCTVSAEPDAGLEPMKPWDHDVSRNQEPGSQPTVPPRRPPHFLLLMNQVVILVWRSKGCVMMVAKGDKLEHI